MKNNKWKWLGVFTAVMLVCGISVGTSADTRVMWEHNARDLTGIYINDDILSLEQCEEKSYDECMCDPACDWSTTDIGAADEEVRCIPKRAGTLRIFGEDSLSPDFPYATPTGPFDLESPEGPEKDFIVWNPAIMDEFGGSAGNFRNIPAVVVNGQDAHEKVFLRQWYVPDYREPTGRVWRDPEYKTSADIIKEYTFMLLDPNNEPFAGSPGNTSFIFPTAYSNENQIGLDGWDVDGDGVDDPTKLKGIDVASKTIDLGTGLIRLAGSLDDTDMPTDVEFIDHRAEVTFVGSSISASWAMVKIYYPYDFKGEDQIGASEFVMNEGDVLIAGRHEVNVGSDLEPVPILKPWYLKLVAVDILQDNTHTAILEVGRLLQEGESFFSDGAEYDVAKLHILNPPTSGRLQYITLRNPLPKCVGGYNSWFPYLTVNKVCIEQDQPFPMLPPFNKEHDVIDDINISCGVNLVSEVCPVVERWVEETTETRFTTRLCEILAGLGWTSLPVTTRPDHYTALLLPAQPDYRGTGDYLLVSSFKAPNSDYDRVVFDYDVESGGLTDVYINDGIRVYGEDSYNAAFPYTDPAGPFDPASDEAPGKDFITFNPAIMPDQGPGSTQFYREALFVNGNDAAEKAFLRQWYVPEYPEPAGNTWNDAQPTILTADIVKEYSFMLVDPDLDPYPGSAGSTSFIFPTTYNNSTTDKRDNRQIGLECWDVDDDGEYNPTLLNDVDVSTKTIDISTDLLRLQGVNAGQRTYETDVEFLDHRAEIEFVGSSVSGSWIEVTIYYPSEYRHEDQIGSSKFHMAEGDILVAGRHTVDAGQPEAITAPWYIELVAVDIFTTPYTAVVRAGRLLQEGESFFSDGAEYDVAKIQTEGDQLLYVTLRNPLPKCEPNRGDVSLINLTVVKECIASGQTIPMLPPFNKRHAVVDDVGVNCNMAVRTDVPAIFEYWNLQTTEPRFTPNLCEIYDGSGGWTSQGYHTMPDAYTEFVLPTQTNVTDYLFTSSWVLQDGGGTTPPKDYCISGTVTDGEVPIPGVNISVDGAPGVTGADGTYEVCQLKAGQYTVEATSSCYTFDPESQSVTVSSSDLTGIDFTGTDTCSGNGKYTISGMITDGTGAEPIEGVTVAVTLQEGGGAVGSAQTGTDGMYVVTGIAGGGDYRVTPSAGECDFTPPHTLINDLAGNTTEVNFESEGCVVDSTVPPGPGTTNPPIDDDPVIDDPIDDDPVIDDPEAAQISVEDAFLIRSRWFILPSFLTIKGTNTSFNASTKVTFDPKNAVLTLMKRVVNEETIATFVLVMPSWFAIADGQEIALKVITGPEEARSAVDVKMLSTVLAGE